MHSEQKTTFNRILSVLWMIVKVILVLIYGCGYYVEKVIFALFRLVRWIVTIGWFRSVCNVGEWVLATIVRFGKWLAHLGHVIAESFVRDFSWWAPCIGAVCFVAVLIVSNFFSIALEVTINDNVVGYVTNEEEYHAILNQVEADIQTKLDSNIQADAVDTTVIPDKTESDKKQNIVVNATATEPEEGEEKEELPTISSLNLEGESYALTTTAKYSLSLVRKIDLATEDDLYTDVYNAVSELVGTNWGLYIDGELKAATTDKALLDTVLEEIRKPYETDEANSRIEFVEDVVVKKGMFSSDMIKDEEQLRMMFETDSDNPAYYICKDGDYLSTIAKQFDMTTAQLKALNPNVKETAIYPGLKLNIAAPDIYLRVKTVKTEIYTESVDFSVKRENNDELYVGTTKVKTEGVKGERKVTADVTYIDGQRVSKQVVDTEIIKKPVDKVIYVGTKKRASSGGGSGNGYVGGNFSQGSGNSSGSLSNPLPGSYVSCGWYGYSGHRALDLCIRGGTLNAPVCAADGGTVIFSGWSGGYGNMIKIQHSGGMVTAYAHLNTRYVQVGDKVSKGQMIGRAGSTGNSTGPHLHFEVIINGNRVNPMNYL